MDYSEFPKSTFYRQEQKAVNDMDKNGTAANEYMHESIKKDAVKCDIPTSEIITALCHDNEIMAERIKELEGTSRCPCGGTLEGTGYGKITKDVVFDCNKCGAQLIIEYKLWQQILKR